MHLFLKKIYRKNPFPKIYRINQCEVLNQITNSFPSERFKHAKFIAFYQPYQVTKEVSSIHQSIIKETQLLNYLHDFSMVYDSLGEKIYTDPVHVNQTAKNTMGEKMANFIAKEIY